MKKLVKFTLPLLTAASIAAPIAATVSCGSSNSINPKGTLTIAVWKGNDKEDASKQALLDGFKAKNPDVNVKYVYYSDRVQDLSKWAAAGDMPDIVLLDSGDFPEMARLQTIQPIDGAKMATHKDFSELASSVFAPMVAKVENGTYHSASDAELSAAVDAAMPSELSSVKFSTKVADGFKVYGLPKDFSTLIAYQNTDLWQNAPASFANFDEFATAIKGVAKPTTAGVKGATAQLGMQNDFAREIGMLTPAFYNKYKDMNRTQLLAAINDGSFKTDLLAASTNSKAQFELRKAGTAASPVEHLYGWNGEAFDNAAVASVIEGNWFTPEHTDKTQMAPIAGISGLYYSGWALSATLNDEDAAYKFLDYATYGEGAIKNAWNDATMGFEIPAKSQLKAMVDLAKAVPTTDASKHFVADSFLKHTAALAGATPNIFTRNYSDFLAAWGDTFGVKVDSNSNFDSIINKVVDSFKAKLEAIAE